MPEYSRLEVQLYLDIPGFQRGGQGSGDLASWVRLPWLAHDEAPGPYITIPQYRFNKTKEHTHWVNQTTVTSCMFPPRPTSTSVSLAPPRLSPFFSCSFLSCFAPRPSPLSSRPSPSCHPPTLPPHPASLNFPLPPIALPHSFSPCFSPLSSHTCVGIRSDPHQYGPSLCVTFFPPLLPSFS